VYPRNDDDARRINVADRHVLALAGRLRDAGFDDPAERIEGAYDREARILALSIDEREQILRSLETAPAEFAELRAVLLTEHEWRLREGMV
jgi:hypothetical protein